MILFSVFLSFRQQGMHGVFMLVVSLPWLMNRFNLSFWFPACVITYFYKKIIMDSKIFEKKNWLLTFFNILKLVI
jgi:hypothetical protein